ncbi:MAG TPA: LEA type 2 family protein [Flavisolibacter sp.]
MKTFTLLFSATVLLVLFNGCKDIKSPEFKKIDQFQVRNVGLQDATVAFNVTYFNPNDFGVTVKETAVDVYIDTVYAGKFQQTGELSVAENADFSIPLSGIIPFQKMMNLDLTGIQTRELLIRADGSVKVGKAGIFITRPIQYQGRHTLSEIRL